MKIKWIQKRFREKLPIWIAVAGVLGFVLLFSGCGGAEQTQEDEQSQQQTDFSGRGEEQEQEDVSGSFDPAGKTILIPEKKEELISVQADASGKPKKIEVSGTLSGFPYQERSYLQDRSGLTDLKNSRGEETWSADRSGNVYWQNLGEEIHYEGISDRALPVDLQVQYFLNGEEKTLEELAGQDGHVQIRFSYTPKAKQSGSGLAVPFLAMSMVALPEEGFSNVQLEHGRVTELGGQKVAIGYALPGLAEDVELDKLDDMEDIEIPDTVEIEADVEDFSLEFTATILSSGLFADLDTEKLDSFDEKIEDMQEMEDAVSDLEKAAGELIDGTAELQNGLEQYANGVNQLSAAIETLDDTLSAYDFSSLQTLGSQLQNLDGALPDLSGLESLTDLADVPGIPEVYLPLLQQLAALPGEMQEMQEGLGALAAAGEQLSALQSGLTELQKAVAQLDAGAAALPDAGQGLYDGLSKLIDGETEFRDGIKEFREEGVQELVKTYREDLGGLIKRIRATKAADQSYRGYTPALAGQEVTSSFLIETEGTP